ncbi:aldose epimerase [Castellaniella sp.]|uniref:aldose epimerase family protein n=1 Tax=Castellaniella sp. TaxID=1955812 RepID=UPI002AFDD6DD|nr:aldose epimerase [Castellaniella sp.]
MMTARMDATAQRCLTLTRGPHRLRVGPAAGGRILSWTSDLPDGPQDWLVPIQAQEWPAHEWPKGGLFPLVPFSNRIRNARMNWGGQMIRIHPLTGQAHALHGQAQRMVWDVLDATDHRAVLGTRLPAGEDGWPWAWSLRQTIHLSADGVLDVELALTNEDTQPMPAGLGLHPYFTADAVHAFASKDWAHEQELALFPRPNRQTRWQRTDSTWTSFLSGWTGRADITWSSGPGLTLQARGPLDHLVLHCNAGRYLCVEPATHVCDAVNLAASGIQGTGLRTLAPGGTLSVGMTLSIRT